MDEKDPWRGKKAIAPAVRILNEAIVDQHISPRRTGQGAITKYSESRAKIQVFCRGSDLTGYLPVRHVANRESGGEICAAGCGAANPKAETGLVAQHPERFFPHNVSRVYNPRVPGQQRYDGLNWMVQARRRPAGSRRSGRRSRDESTRSATRPCSASCTSRPRTPLPGATSACTTFDRFNNRSLLGPQGQPRQRPRRLIKGAGNDERNAEAFSGGEGWIQPR